MENNIKNDIQELIENVKNILHEHNYNIRIGMEIDDPRNNIYYIVVENFLYIRISGWENCYTYFSIYKVSPEILTSANISLISDNGLNALCQYNFSSFDTEKNNELKNIYKIIENNSIVIDEFNENYGRIEFMSMNNASQYIITAVLQVLGKTTPVMDNYLKETKIKIINELSIKQKEKEEKLASLNLAQFRAEMKYFCEQQKSEINGTLLGDSSKSKITYYRVRQKN